MDIPREARPQSTGPALAKFGGPKSCNGVFPSRLQFGQDAQAAVNEVFAYYRSIGQDFGTQGHFEELYTGEFAEFLGVGGYCDAVCSGTAALYVALGSLDLPKGSRVLISPIADPGCISAIVLQGLIPKLIDVECGSYNTSLAQIRGRLDPEVSCILLIHSGGMAIRDIADIAEYCLHKRIRLIEDCSQAHGARVNDRFVGTFGDVGVFSTMSTKTHSTGGAGGVIHTADEGIYHRVRELSDRGKAFFSEDFDPKNPATFHGPALNLPQDELSCAIGRVTLRSLEGVRKRRVALIAHLNLRLEETCRAFRGLPVAEGDSPFFWPIRFWADQLDAASGEILSAVIAEGVPINPRYRYLVADWPWATALLADSFSAPNADKLLKHSFNLLFHERFDLGDMDSIAAAMLKVERAF